MLQTETEIAAKHTLDRLWKRMGPDVRTDRPFEVSEEEYAAMAFVAGWSFELPDGHYLHFRGTPCVVRTPRLVVGVLLARCSRCRRAYAVVGSLCAYCAPQ
jgi:hypothetical protein